MTEDRSKPWPQSSTDIPGCKVPLDVQPRATFSLDGKYRFSLTRDCKGPGSGKGAVTFLMLNPSTATSTTDDPTIAKCRKYVAAWHYRWLYVVNLSPLKTPLPRKLVEAGPEPDDIWETNVAVVKAAAANSDFLVAAYGVQGHHQGRDQRILEALDPYAIWALQITQGGYPHHPLYLADDLKPIPFRQARGGASSQSTWF